MVVPVDFMERQTKCLPNSATSTDRLVVQHVLSEEGMLALESEWRTLESRAPQLPFSSFDWLIPWWRHLSARQRFVRDQLMIITFRAKSGELRGIAPMMITHRPGLGLFGFRQLQFFGADPNITELRGIVAHSEYTNQVYAALLDNVGQLPVRWNTMKLTGIPGTDCHWDAKIAEKFASRSWHGDTVNPILSLPSTWEEFRGALSRNMKESLRKCYNAPKRDGLVFDFVTIENPAAIGQSLETFFQLHRARAEMNAAVQHRNYFMTAASQAFLIEVCDRFARRGALRIFQLRLGSTVIATRLGFLIGDSLYLYYSGFDPAYQKYSAMTTVVAESIKYAIAQGCRTVNLSTGRDISKTRWSPTEVVYKTVDFSPRDWTARCKHRVYLALSNGARRGPADRWYARLFARSAQ